MNLYTLTGIGLGTILFGVGLLWAFRGRPVAAVKRSEIQPPRYVYTEADEALAMRTAAKRRLADEIRMQAARVDSGPRLVVDDRRAS